MNINAHGQGVGRYVHGRRVVDLYERETAERAEIDLLMSLAKKGVESFSLSWHMVEGQWQLVAKVESVAH